MTSTVALFRKRLLSYSETFIADQGRLLPTYRPVFCGYRHDNSGLHLLEGSDKLLLEDHSSLGSLSKFLLRHGLGGGKRWIRAIASETPALIHAHFFNDGIDAVKIGARLDRPVITTVHGHDITKHENARTGHSISRRFFEQVDGVVAVSNFIAEQALARGCPENKLIQHYIGIDLDKFSQPKEESTRPSLLFVGRLVEKKGCTYLLQAMERLKTRFPELMLTIIGAGNLDTELQREASVRGLNVVFAGTASAAEIRQHLSRSWLFVAPSITAQSGDAEGLGMVFLEAQALQTPVVSFRSGGLVEAVEDEVSALLSDEKDVAGLAENIATLLENSNLRHDMGLAGRKRVEQHFDLRKQCAKLETIYDKLS
ncbi:MAG: glycosyltransferase [Gammaproteobacteria bacterium]|nr:glycosyltransferase [Gammaproteobacteria bacterium]